jgi:uncharacterized protein YdeI (YjbR/CyaY-like superfamily)
MPEPNNIKFFKSEEVLRKWFEKNHAKAADLWIGYYKRASGKKGVVYKQALDIALCFGWIDGIVKGIDEHQYCQRYTPRRKGSIWSAINIKKIDELIKKGLVAPAGLKAYNGRDKAKTNLYSFEQKNLKFPPALEKKFKRNKKAWENFNFMIASYKRPATWWVISAKQEETRQRRLDELIRDSEAGRKIKQLKRPGE